MLSPGDPPEPALAASSAGLGSRCAADVLQEARELERAGRIAEAIVGYEATIARAEGSGEAAVLAEALRRLAILRQQRDESAPARMLCARSYEVARAIGDDALAAEALNTLGGLHLATGAPAEARQAFVRALELGRSRRDLQARVHQNLGILANIQGDVEEALARYQRSLAAYRDCGDEHGCAITYHNLGMVSADRGLFAAADTYFRESRVLAERTGDAYLQGLCLVNRAEMDVTRQRFENARQDAEASLAIFERLGARGPKADAYRVIGTVYRETGRPALAESRLRAAIDLAGTTGSVLSEAEAARELALLYQTMGRNQEALSFLNRAYRLFRRLDARLDLVHVGGKVAALEGAYRAVVREWGRSIESAHGGTFTHCERVARNAAAVARALGLDDQAETTVLLGAFLHDVGKVRVPHELLHKPGPLTPEEEAVLQMHPVWGVELLAGVEFPWDLKPIIRWHHERCDGTGYPDRLKGDEIPLAAQIVGIVDTYDILTVGQSGEGSCTPAQAIEHMAASRRWWSDRVFDAFISAVPPRD
jgi:putative nucleotidyltransferase with HDIG domain